MSTLTIGQVAKEAGVGVETLRYYEREGLVKEPPRRVSGYRQYPEDVVKRIHFIKRAQELGFSLKEIAELLGRPQGEPSAAIRERVAKARQIQQERLAKERRPLYASGAMEAGQIRKYCSVDGEVKELLRSAIRQFGLSARAFRRILKLSRTIADLVGSAEIGVPHVAGCPLGGRSSIARWTGGCGADRARYGWQASVTLPPAPSRKPWSAPGSTPSPASSPPTPPLSPPAPSARPTTPSPIPVSSAAARSSSRAR